jgi:Ser/Thr protein kinase RdoA (MazF antagonist)
LKSRNIEAPLPNLTYILPENSRDGLFVVDTGDVYGALEGTSNDRRRLEQVCNQLGIKTGHMHNAGNDAHFTLVALRDMAEGGPLDMQRDRRWPNQTAGIKLVPRDDEQVDNYDDDDDDDWFAFSPKTSNIRPTASNVVGSSSPG